MPDWLQPAGAFTTVLLTPSKSKSLVVADGRRTVNPLALAKRTDRSSWLLWLAVLACNLVTTRTTLGAVVVDIRGKAHLNALAQCDKEGLCTVRGSLQDDLGEPLVNAPIQATLDDPKATSEEAAVGFEDCSTRAGRSVETRATAASGARTFTNHGGDFCLRLTNAQPASRRMRIEFAGDEHTDADTARIELVALRPPADIEWLNPSKLVDIGRTELRFDLRLHTPEKSAGQQPLQLVLSDPRSTDVILRKTETTDSAGVAHFLIEGQQLGTIGAARLQVFFDGAPNVAPAERSWQFFRACHVRLATEHAPQNVTLGEHARLSLSVRTQCRQPVPGIVEFSVQEQVLLRAPINHNSVKWDFQAARHPPGPIKILATYVPPSEGWIPDGGTRIDLTIHPPSAKGGILWLFGTISLVIWLVLKWGRGSIRLPLRRDLAQKSDPSSSIDRTPPEAGKSGWYGFVLDAHTGQPITNARVRIEHPGFTEKQIGASATSSASGEFALPPQNHPDLARLLVDARFYAPGQWPLPPQGKLIIRLQTNRRAILRAFVAWFESSVSKGNPRPEPTPGEVSVGILVEHPPEVVEWAKNVEEAAFGPTSPDIDAAALLSGPPQPSRPGREL
jgi:hypothetical protein